ncbi:MAG: UDP-N-acetylmuramoyl-L-alanine--D-glutamate ligase [Trueperaceae bacterium]|nr:MAG: UDP-N-acetylmuramoyl-L-alanine--D-glutamate ligase [Trueperaceae bacterium]
MRLLVYGLGRSGGAVVRRARAAGDTVGFVDARRAGPDVDEALALGAERIEDVAAWPADLCVAAPGVPIDHPDLERLRLLGSEVIGEVEWMARSLSARIVGITGTAGKGSVTRWLTDLLVAGGVDAIAGGNLDPALAAVARPDATWVVELSSFQLERCPTLRPDVAVVLNLGVDHLDRHVDVATYHAAKRSLLANLTPEQAFVFDAGDATLRRWAAATPARLLPYATSAQAVALLRDELGIECAASVHVIDDVLRLGDTPLLGAAELRVQGRHQHANALAVAVAASELGLEHAAIERGLRAFPGLAGRYAEIGRLAGVRFIDDSIATRELAVAAALETTPAPIVWIAGGVDKGADVESLAGLVAERVTLMLGIGDSGARLCERVGAWTRSERIDASDGREAMRQAVRRAWEVLGSEHGASGSVLLAPLAASFDQFRDYRDRGDAFRAAIAALVGDVCAADARPGATPTEGVTWTPSS